ncbi:DUF2868 domain-containing protein [Noviherbaspirillum sp. CPCC 100848]|uniref:DUF2868 domain-containing protein n=1 Tax=Noviherbaspirillum album TaxID=3080276 RepID=A0ABU6JBA7_9BURK|nr:DUF2868 domain-containing protein [Noviherbaspirillum sp. CPCC 100848]MEC4720937.1 DUF2868 domain-containing protein [Noviherbaspirillum sp. CPCC 100848]
MNERMARDVVLMSAIENADQERRILSDEDRTYASRSANELSQWELADKAGKGTGLAADAHAELFLSKRAEQVLKKVADRHPAFSRFTGLPGGWRLFGIVLPLAAVLAGFLADRVADPHRVDLLSPPLLFILGWNLLVYLGLLLLPLAGRRQAGGRSMLTRFAGGRLTMPRKLPQALGTALARFGEEWTRLSMPLSAARFKRTMHLAAAALAVGAILSLYVRGLLTEYRAGWESTFLDAAQVHAILSYLFAPATMLFGIEGFTLSDVQALQTPQVASAAGGARWVHLYAATLLLFVVLPRTLLSLAAGWKAKRLARRFPIDIGQPYFRKLTAHLGRSDASILRIFPYSFTVDETRDRNLAAVAQMLIGEQSRVMLRPSTAYGDLPQDAAADKDIALTAALFNMNATPEKENHGAFLAELARGRPGGTGAKGATGAAPFLALIDESSYLERIGGQAGGEQRLRERAALWLQFCEMHKVPAIVVNLLNPQSRAVDIERGLATLATLDRAQ